MNEQYEITEAELEIMQVLWKNKRGNLTTIMEELSKKSKTEEKNKNTIKTLIHRLIQKGAIESQKVNNKEVEYIPKINEKKFITKESNSFLNKFFNGNTEKLLLNFVENKKVTKKELQKLIDILEQDEE
ncbi:transcriptional regulator [Clostridium sp. CAG:356]|nr:transcriptional regulator [Clostridium sp. CAG:356]